jgi:hypothetical protein
MRQLRPMTWLRLAGLSVLIASCTVQQPIPQATGNTPSPIASPAAVLPAGEVALPALVRPSLEPGVEWGCAGIGLSDAVLHGDAQDPKVAWLSLGSSRIDVLWPAGFRARFNPRLEVLDEAGTVIARERDPVWGGCTTATHNVLSMEPPFEIGP